MKIGILGTRGIPNAYGGFEQFAQYLAEGLVRNGHHVWVYSSSDHIYQEKEWNHIQIIHCKDWESKLGTAGQFVYDLNCILDARKRDYDILLQLGYTSNSIWHSLWPRKAVNIVNMDGLEWKRSKYNRLTRLFLKRAEYWAARHGDLLIADSTGIRNYLLQKYQKQSVFIPYGAELFQDPAANMLEEWSLGPQQYGLVIARMEPENNVEMIIQGYLRSSQPWPLVIVGNTTNRFGQYLRNLYRENNIFFSNGIYDSVKLNNLRYFSALYFHGHSVGGTNPSLLEAMACQCNIVAHHNPFNEAVLADCALYFQKPDDIRDIIDHLPELAPGFGDKKKRNLASIHEFYNWPSIISQYEKVFSNSLSL